MPPDDDDDRSEFEEELISEIQNLRADFAEYEQSNAAKRGENVRLLIALGVSGLLGTLYAQHPKNFLIINPTPIYSIHILLLEASAISTIIYLFIKIVQTYTYTQNSIIKACRITNKISYLFTIPILVAGLSMVSAVLIKLLNISSEGVMNVSGLIGSSILVISAFIAYYLQRRQASVAKRWSGKKLEREILRYILDKSDSDNPPRGHQEIASEIGFYNEGDNGRKLMRSHGIVAKMIRELEFVERNSDREIIVTDKDKAKQYEQQLVEEMRN